MATSMYKAEPQVYDIMRDLVGQYHPDLALVVDEIAIVFREKAASAGGRPVYGKARKATPLLGVLGDTDYKFILELAADEWLNLTSRQHQALIDHLLCACRADEEDGAIKCHMAPADVEFFFDELDRWGDWRPRPANEDGTDGENGSGTSIVEDVFVRKPVASPAPTAGGDHGIDGLLDIGVD